MFGHPNRPGDLLRAKLNAAKRDRLAKIERAQIRKVTLTDHRSRAERTLAPASRPEPKTINTQPDPITNLALFAPATPEQRAGREQFLVAIKAAPPLALFPAHKE